MAEPLQLHEGTGATFSIYEGEYSDGRKFYEVSGPGISRYNSARECESQYDAKQLVRLLNGAYCAGKLAKAVEIKNVLTALFTKP